MRHFSAVAQQKLVDSGWFEGRDMASCFHLPEWKKMPECVTNFCREFGYLHLKFKGHDSHREEVIFDFDDSEKSQMLRAYSFGYDNLSNVPKVGDVDFDQHHLIEPREFHRSVNEQSQKHLYKVGTYIGDTIFYDIYMGDGYCANAELEQLIKLFSCDVSEFISKLVVA